MCVCQCWGVLEPIGSLSRCWTSVRVEVERLLQAADATCFGGARAMPRGSSLCVAMRGGCGGSGLVASLLAVYCEGNGRRS
jgi:hypothetical protein